ncbi:hypothetical protein DPEC_G00185670 [Dallia pectoralis]|uniref:Uncharacterized protein n=1 Tax=Dallia pectoralis TaxID=75939 RepID=A0ACC2GBH2_DALPE|nr:hypothetical protein DPEC_G00185670 [Dallia pectoralis]
MSPPSSPRLRTRVRPPPRTSRDTSGVNRLTRTHAASGRGANAVELCPPPSARRPSSPRSHFSFVVPSAHHADLPQCLAQWWARSTLPTHEHSVVACLDGETGGSVSGMVQYDTLSAS